jgi:hypothetical protein
MRNDPPTLRPYCMGNTRLPEILLGIDGEGSPEQWLYLRQLRAPIRRPATRLITLNLPRSKSVSDWRFQSDASRRPHPAMACLTSDEFSSGAKTMLRFGNTSAGSKGDDNGSRYRGTFGSEEDRSSQRVEAARSASTSLSIELTVRRVKRLRARALQAGNRSKNRVSDPAGMCHCGIFISEQH